MVASGKTLLKRSAAWLNPIVLLIGILLLTILLPSPLKDWVGCAAFNEAYFLFFVILLVAVLKAVKPFEKNDKYVT